MLFLNGMLMYYIRFNLFATCSFLPFTFASLPITDITDIVVLYY
ncbi:hypothetical protein HMPREF9078_02495 [Capnocytophaga sp. oral taxon 380 str. F0488]|nr:hypothetical protein HMPREF9078_02495 [Capnocytophaga sp. oral taxon 380 str. F0488]